MAISRKVWLNELLVYCNRPNYPIAELVAIRSGCDPAREEGSDGLKIKESHESSRHMFIVQEGDWRQCQTNPSVGEVHLDTATIHNALLTVTQISHPTHALRCE